MRDPKAAIINAAREAVRDLPSYSVSESIEDVLQKYSLESAVYLASNENPYGCSPKVAEAVSESVSQINRYPDGAGVALKADISAQLQCRPGNVFLGNGSNEILEAVAKTFLSPNDEVIISQHAFSMYRLFSHCYGAVIREIACNDWFVDLEGMLNAVTNRTKVVFIANANNPTGTMLDSDRIRLFLDCLPANVLVVIDEAYIEFSKQEFGNSGELVDQFPNLVVSRTFSKAYGLAGARIGFGIGQAETIQLLEKVRQPFNINYLALVSARAALSDQDFLASSLEKTRVQKERFENHLKRLGVKFLPSEANFVTFSLGDKARQGYEFLLSKGVIVRPLVSYQMDDWLRASIGTEKEMNTLIAVLTEYVEQMR